MPAVSAERQNTGDGNDEKDRVLKKKVFVLSVKDIQDPQHPLQGSWRMTSFVSRFSAFRFPAREIVTAESFSYSDH